MKEINVLCWKCQKRIGEMPMKIGFRAMCPHCGIDLHTCKNCKFYCIGKPNDCSVFGTDPVKDREANNFCEEFQLKLPSSEKSSSEKAKKLFGEDPNALKKDFNSLFDDKDE